MTAEQDSCKTCENQLIQQLHCSLWEQNNSELLCWDNMCHIKRVIEILCVMRERQSISSLYMINKALNHVEYSLKALWTSEPLEHVTSLERKKKRDVLKRCSFMSHKRGLVKRFLGWTLWTHEVTWYLVFKFKNSAGRLLQNRTTHLFNCW